MLQRSIVYLLRITNIQITFKLTSKQHMLLIVRVPWGWTWIRLIKYFSLQILVAHVIPIGNPLDDIASNLGILSNMLIKAAITRNPFLPNIGENEHAIAIKMVSIPRFLRSRNHMRPFLES